MFLNIEYLYHDPAAPDLSDDPLLSHLEIGERWLRRRIDLANVSEFAELPQRDRCIVVFYSGRQTIVRSSYDLMIAIHEHYFLTLTQLTEGTAEA